MVGVEPRPYYSVLFAGGRRKWNIGIPFYHQAKCTSSKATKISSTSLPSAGEAFSLPVFRCFTIECFSWVVYGGALCDKVRRLGRSNPIHVDAYYFSELLIENRGR